MRDTVTKQSRVSINTVLNAEFAVKDVMGVKSFHMRNHVLFAMSN